MLWWIWIVSLLMDLSQAQCKSCMKWNLMCAWIRIVPNILYIVFKVQIRSDVWLDWETYLRELPEGINCKIALEGDYIRQLSNCFTHHFCVPSCSSTITSQHAALVYNNTNKCKYDYIQCFTGIITFDFLF